MTNQQVNDEPYLLETMSGRVMPGEGHFDLVSFVRALDATGSRVPYAVEVIRLDTKESPADLAHAAANSTRAVLAKARS